MRASGSRGASRRLAPLLLLVLLAVGCSGGPAGPPPPGRAPAAQELTVGFGADPYQQEDAAPLGMYPLNANLFETLVYLNASYELEPRLAERWEFLPPNTWRFFLRRNARFHDGSPLDAEAVKVGLFERVAKLPGGGAIAARPGSATVVDRYTIDFTSTEPDLRLPQQIASPQFGVVAPGSDPRQRPIGTGPFRFLEYRPGEQLVAERYPRYWGAPQASVDRIRFRFYPDPELRAKALESGQISFAYGIRRQEVQELRQRDFQVVTAPVGGSAAVLLRTGGPPPHDLLADLNVRKAIGYAIDRPAAGESLPDGFDGTQQSFIPPLAIAPYGGGVKGYYFSREDAKGILEDSGWLPGPDGVRQKGGRRLRLSLVSGFPDARTEAGLASFLQDALQRIGAEVEVLQTPDTAAYQARLSEGRGDLYLEERYQEDADPLSLALRFYGGGRQPSPYAALFGPRGTFDRLIASALLQPDPDKLRQDTTVAVHELVDVQAVVLPIGGTFQIYGMSSSVQGLVAHPSPVALEWNRVVLV